MKNIKRFSIITTIALVLLVFNSCDDSSEKFEIGTPDAPVLQELNFVRLELDAVNTNNPAVTLNWAEANYGQQASVNYSIEFSKTEDFAESTVATTVTGKTSLTLSVSEVNTAAGNAGLNPFNWENIYIRVNASLGTQDSQKIASNSLLLEVYPYFNYTFNDYYLVGDATAPGWNNNNNNPALFRDPNDANRYFYTGFWAENGHFKVLSTLGEWQPQYGTDDGTTVGANLGGGTDPERFPYGGGNGIPAGFYTFEINFATNTFSFEAFDASGKTSPASLILKGSSTTDISMNALAFDGHIWYAKDVKLTPGNVEFETGAGAKWGSSTSFSGIATDGGGAIPVVVEDNYDVWFNDLTGRYILIPLNL
ncbi:SusE domain-containing protein [Polaribacter batillariae]|uniref:SusE domain-containing protein n=1 Tax=Polaribacter batillariae TaxID=2808900 RepID=A0ABX7SVR5_9FLAO|nr:SusE domain-containing protein [Polaribacter batillariae]QTD38349.1 SusE domain-containing protein [Polaribacter batillariae]